MQKGHGKSQQAHFHEKQHLTWEEYWIMNRIILSIHISRPEKMVAPGSIALSPPSLSHSPFLSIYLFTFGCIRSSLLCICLIAVASPGQSAGSKVQVSVQLWCLGLMLSGIWDLSSWTVSPALQGRLLTTGPPGKSLSYSLDGNTTLRLSLPRSTGPTVLGRVSGLEKSTLYHILSHHPLNWATTILTTCRPQTIKLSFPGETQVL